MARVGSLEMNHMGKRILRNKDAGITKQRPAPWPEMEGNGTSRHRVGAGTGALPDSTLLPGVVHSSK